MPGHLFDEVYGGNFPHHARKLLYSLPGLDMEHAAEALERFADAVGSFDDELP